MVGLRVEVIDTEDIVLERKVEIEVPVCLETQDKANCEGQVVQ